MTFENVVVPVKFCENCGKQLSPKVYASGSQESMAEFGKRRFCNRKCKGEGSRLPNGPKLGGLPHRGRKIARRKVVKTKCSVCSTTERLEVHHKDGDATNNSLDNLQVVCMDCHRKIHKRVGCSVSGCDLPYRAKGYCCKHYQRFAKYGDPLVKKLHSKWSPEKVDS